jgi:hypothetical protein
MKRFLAGALLIAMLCVLAPAGHAQQVPYAGQSRVSNFWVGPNFGKWAQRVAAGSTTAGTYSITIQGPGSVTAGGNQSFVPFNPAVRITVGVGAVRETIKPTSVTGCAVGQAVNPCVVTATFAFAHGAGTPIVSGSCGFDEANLVASQNGGGIVLMDNNMGCTAVTITTSIACFINQTTESMIPNGVTGGPFYYVNGAGNTCVPANNNNPGFGPSGPAAPSLGTAANYAALAQSGITLTGTDTFCGNIASTPTTTITGTPTFTCGGAVDQPNAAAAMTAAIAAYNSITPVPCTTTYPPAADLGGQTLPPGVYCDSSSFAVTGTLTLDAQGNPNANWIFKTVSTLTTATSAVINLINGAKASHVFWQVGSSATFGTSTIFNGTVLTFVSDTINGGAGAVNNGSVLAGLQNNGTGAITQSASGTTTATAKLPQ